VEETEKNKKKPLEKISRRYAMARGVKIAMRWGLGGRKWFKTKNLGREEGTRMFGAK